MTARALLLLACSQRKRHDPQLLPAIRRYDGPLVRVVRKWKHEHPRAGTQLDVYFLSAEYGVIWSGAKIPDYDRRMTAQRADELAPSVRQSVEALLAKEYTHICFALGKTYMRTIRDTRLFQNARWWLITGGRIGEQAQQLKQWLIRLEGDQRV